MAESSVPLNDDEVTRVTLWINDKTAEALQMDPVARTTGGLIVPLANIDQLKAWVAEQKTLPPEQQIPHSRIGIITNRWRKVDGEDSAAANTIKIRQSLFGSLVPILVYCGTPCSKSVKALHKPSDWSFVCGYSAIEEKGIPSVDDMKMLKPEQSVAITQQQMKDVEQFIKGNFRYFLPRDPAKALAMCLVVSVLAAKDWADERVPAEASISVAGRPNQVLHVTGLGIREGASEVSWRDEVAFIPRYDPRKDEMAMLVLWAQDSSEIPIGGCIAPAPLVDEPPTWLPLLRHSGARNATGKLHVGVSVREIVKEGWLGRERTRLYSILIKGAILFYTDDTLSQLKLKIPLNSSSVVVETGEKQFTIKGAQGFFTFACESTKERSQWVTCIHKIPKREWLGIPLQDIMKRQSKFGIKSDIPFFLEHALTFLESNALNEQGLFRISGDIHEEEGVLDKLDLVGPKNSVFLDPQQNCHTVVSLIKHFLRDLPDYIVPTELHEPLSRALESKDTAVPAVFELLKQLPPLNRLILQKLVRLLFMIQANEAQTRMTAATLGISFGLSLLKPKPVAGDMPLNAKDVSRVVDLNTKFPMACSSFFITNYKQLFPETAPTARLTKPLPPPPTKSRSALASSSAAIPATPSFGGRPPPNFGPRPVPQKVNTEEDGAVQAGIALFRNYDKNRTGLLPNEFMPLWAQLDQTYPKYAANASANTFLSLFSEGPVSESKFASWWKAIVFSSH